VVTDTRVYDKRDDVSFPIVNFPFLDGDVTLVPLHGVKHFSVS
jgi:hypothetical protein